MTLLEKINNLTWFSEIIKLKEILKELFLNSSQNLQKTADIGNISTSLKGSSITIPNKDINVFNVITQGNDGYSQMYSTDKSIGTEVHENFGKQSGFIFSTITGSSKPKIFNQDSSSGNKEIYLELDDPTTIGITTYNCKSRTLPGVYNIAVESLITGTFINPTSIKVENGIITAIS
jgi:hypothetical protein